VTAEMVAMFEAMTGRTLYPAHPSASRSMWWPTGRCSFVSASSRRQTKPAGLRTGAHLDHWPPFTTSPAGGIGLPHHPALFGRPAAPGDRGHPAGTQSRPRTASSRSPLHPRWCCPPVGRPSPSRPWPPRPGPGPTAIYRARSPSGGQPGRGRRDQHDHQLRRPGRRG
jgi:hypothetical protein